MVGGLNLYFYTYALGDSSLFSTSMLWAGIFGIGSLILFPRLIKTFGRKKVFQMSILMPIVSAGVLYFASGYPASAVLLVPVAGIAYGLSNAVYWLMILLMVADTVDYGDMKLGIRSESISYSSHTLVIKCTGALTGFLVGITLTLIDYVPNQEQTVETLVGLKSVYLASTLLCIAAYFIYRKFYRLNDGELDKIQHELQEKYAAEPAMT